MNNGMIIIYGPTGVGKTDFALKLAEQLPCEMINMDVGQFYTPLTIGTAKPDLSGLPLPYHFFDLLDEPVNCTVTNYRSMILDLLPTIWSRNRKPLLVGGSGFYLRSLFFPPVAPAASDNVQEVKVGDSWQLLYELDPERATEIDPRDSYRIQRALTLVRTTGKKASELRPVYQSMCPFVLVYLERDRAELYQRIDDRVVQMIDEGWIEEVERLDRKWQSFIATKKIIGYAEIIAYLDARGGMSMEELIRLIQQRTRNYAKRQMTFWRMLQAQLVAHIQPDSPDLITSINLTLADVDLYIKQLVVTIQNKKKSE